MILKKAYYIPPKTNLFQCRFVHLQVRMDWPEIEPRSLQCQAGDQPPEPRSGLINEILFKTLHKVHISLHVFLSFGLVLTVL